MIKSNQKRILMFYLIFYNLAKKNRTRPFIYPGKQISTLYPRFYCLSKRTLMFYPDLFHLAKESKIKPLLFILEKQISIFFAFTIHPREVSHILHKRLSQSLKSLLFRGVNFNALFAFLSSIPGE